MRCNLPSGSRRAPPPGRRIGLAAARRPTTFREQLAHLNVRRMAFTELIDQTRTHAAPQCGHSGFMASLTGPGLVAARTAGEVRALRRLCRGTRARHARLSL